MFKLEYIDFFLTFLTLLHFSVIVYSLTNNVLMFKVDLTITLLELT